ncbi:MAG: hypothetical protein IJ685_11345, partial [Selenomonadaceae bacterium]|nr:hypothetical protein [Selenomonadaceae bacterium]
NVNRVNCSVAFKATAKYIDGRKLNPTTKIKLSNTRSKISVRGDKIAAVDNVNRVNCSVAFKATAKYIDGRKLNPPTKIELSNTRSKIFGQRQI